jgi:hypothetical protein
MIRRIFFGGCSMAKKKSKAVAAELIETPGVSEEIITDVYNLIKETPGGCTPERVAAFKSYYISEKDVKAAINILLNNTKIRMLYDPDIDSDTGKKGSIPTPARKVGKGASTFKLIAL